MTIQKTKKKGKIMGLDMFLGLGMSSNRRDISTIYQWRKFYELNDFILTEIVAEGPDDLNGHFNPINEDDIEKILAFLREHLESRIKEMPENIWLEDAEYFRKENEIVEKSIEHFEKAIELIKKYPHLQLYYCGWW